MKSLVMWLVKKYAISAINEALEHNKDNVSKANETFEKWVIRLEVIIEQLKKIMFRLSDSNITKDEVDASIEEIKKLIENWK